MPGSFGTILRDGKTGKVLCVGGLVKKGIYENTRRIAIDMAGYKVDKTAFTLSYDRRRDLVEAARRLGELIIKIKNESGQPDLSAATCARNERGSCMLSWARTPTTHRRRRFYS